jgi:ABC-type branched-subunit amino acid transport system ATPase component
VLHFGQVLVDGSPDVAMRDPDVVEAYLGGGDAHRH